MQQSAAEEREHGAARLRHHVDHIIPLNAGGFHHEKNLQVIPASVNASKRDNPFWTLDGYLSWRDVPSFLWPSGLRQSYSDALLGEISISIAA